MGEVFDVQTHHFKQAGVPEIEIETFRFGGVPHGNVWPCNSTVDKSANRQIGCSAAKDATLHCWMGSYPQRAMARYHAKNER